MKNQRKGSQEDVLDKHRNDRNNHVKSLTPPSASSPAVSAAMRGNKAEDTSPELLLRSALWKSGIRGYRKHLKHLPGRPDIAFPRCQLAVFVHGCFWHCCPKCGISIPKANAQYWKEKLHRNVERDKRTDKQLKQADWRTMIIWECEVRQSIERCVDKICQEIKNKP